MNTNVQVLCPTCNKCKKFEVEQNGYEHLPLWKKKEYIGRITGFKEMMVCEDESSAYEYWKNNFNHNPDDCCNLRG